MSGHKIYIVSPYKKTGGPRSLHQLANLLTDKGKEVYMIYGDHSPIMNVTELLYSDCKAKLAFSIEDDSNNILITSEYDTGWHLRYKNVKKVIWWLSLTSYLQNNPWIAARDWTIGKGKNGILIPAMYLKWKFKCFSTRRNQKYLKSNKELQDCYHLYNCEYVKDYLIARGISSNNMQYLCGPIDISDINKTNTIENKKDIVCYSPAKMNMKNFSQIINIVRERHKNYQFVELANMSHDELLNVLNRAKLYVDFGYFPGPERIPREAVSQFCNILTSRDGSAANDIDVPIPDKFKLDYRSLSFNEIANRIIEMVSDYNKDLFFYDEYRRKVVNQIERFTEDIDKVVSYFERGEYDE